MTTKNIAKNQATQQAIELVKLSDKAAAFFGAVHLTTDVFFDALRILDGQQAAQDVKKASLENDYHGFICLVRQAKAEGNAEALEKLINFGKNHIGKLGSKYASEAVTFDEKALSIVKRSPSVVAAFKARQAIDAIMPKLLSLATSAKAEAELKQLEKMPQKAEKDAIAKREALELFAAQCAVKINESKKAEADKAAEAEKAKQAKAAEVTAKQAAEAAKAEADKAKAKAEAEVAAAKAEAAKLAEQLAKAEAKAEADLIAANKDAQERLAKQAEQSANKIGSLQFGKSTEAKAAAELEKLEKRYSEAELVCLAMDILKKHSGDKIASVVYTALDSLKVEQLKKAM